MILGSSISFAAMISSYSEERLVATIAEMKGRIQSDVWPKSRIMFATVDIVRAEERANLATCYAMLHERRGRMFKAKHQISQEEFETEHWQTLFRIEYPEVFE